MNGDFCGIKGRTMCLLLDEGGNPQDGDGTDDGCAKLAQDATPLNAELTEKPATENTTKKAEDQIHDETESTTFHQLAGTEASQTTDNNRTNNSHNRIFKKFNLSVKETPRASAYW